MQRIGDVQDAHAIVRDEGIMTGDGHAGDRADGIGDEVLLADNGEAGDGAPGIRRRRRYGSIQNDRFDKFSQRARAVLALTNEEAQRFNHNYIGAEHLLLGLVREGDGVAAKMLRNLGVDVAKVRSAVEFIIGRDNRAAMGAIGLTPRARTVIELAVDEARRLGHHYIGTEHLLLGMVREGEGIAAGVLQSLGVDLEQVRQQTVLELSQGSGGPASRPEVAATVVCRLDDGELAAVDALVAAGIRGTRQEIVAWLVELGLQTQRDLLARLAQPAPGETPPPGEPSAGDAPPEEQRDHREEGHGRR
jgi:hypothetical protein